MSENNPPNTTNFSTHEVMSRRGFLSGSLKLIVVVSSLGVLPSACRMSENDSSGKRITELKIVDGKVKLDLSSSVYRDLNEVGKGVKLDVESFPRPIIVTRKSTTEVAAFSSVCTHAGFNVLLPVNGYLVCESGHGGSYDLSGKVRTGPPVAPLENFPAEIIGDSVVITFAG